MSSSSSSSSSSLLVIQTGGTIDKDYPKRFEGGGFEISEPASQRIVAAGVPGGSANGIEFTTVCRKDSLEITDADREAVVQAIAQANTARVVVTHGTDTLLVTGKFLQERVAREATVVLTGSLLPERFQNSDAAFNFGMAVAAARVLVPGVYVAMHGVVCEVDKCERDPRTGCFRPVSEHAPTPSPLPVQVAAAAAPAPPSRAVWCKEDGGRFELKDAAWVERNAKGEAFAKFQFVGEFDQPEGRGPAVVLHDSDRNIGVMLAAEQCYWRSGTDKGKWNKLNAGKWAELGSSEPEVRGPPPDPAQLPPLTDAQRAALQDRALPQAVEEKNFKGIAGLYVPFKGRSVCFLVHVSHALATNEPVLTVANMQSLLNAFDSLYEWFARVVGDKPKVHKHFQGLLPVFGLLGKSQVGACCGYVGATGIEMTDSCWVKLYRDWALHAQVDQALPYEFGRNFLLPRLNAKMNYKAPHSGHTVSTGFAVFMRFKGLQDCGLDGAPFRDRSYADFVAAVKALLQQYCARNETWENTLGKGQCFDNEMKLSVCDLWAAFMLHLCDLSDGDFLQRFYANLLQRPDAQTSFDAVDNMVVAASNAASIPLAAQFREWNWPVSQQVDADIAHLA